MDKKEMIEKLRLVFDVGTGILPDNARIALAEVISTLQSSVVLTVDEAKELQSGTEYTKGYTPYEKPFTTIDQQLAALMAAKENG